MTGLSHAVHMPSLDGATGWLELGAARSPLSCAATRSS